MASVSIEPTTSNNGYSTFEKLFEKLLMKDEMIQVGIFDRDKNICDHITDVKNKINDLNIHQESNAKFLLQTLSKDVHLELASFFDFHDNKNNFEWIVEKLTTLYAPKKSECSAFVELLKVRQRPGQKMSDYVSNIRISAMKLMPYEDRLKRED